MPPQEPTLYALRKTTRLLSKPQDYFLGVKWQNRGIPDNILCFHRAHQVHTLAGDEGISGKFDQHHRHVLIIPLFGQGSVGVDQLIFPLKVGQALLVFPHQLHYYPELPEHFDWLFITFELPGNDTSKLAALKNSPRTASLNLVDLICSFVNCFTTATTQNTPIAATHLATELAELLTEFSRCPPSIHDNIHTAIVHRIKAYLYSHLDENLSIANVAKDAGFSESYTRAAFKKHAGVSLGQFILAVRLTHSARLLRTSERRIATIARACGFDSQLSFSRAFKRSFRVSPRDYRKQIT